MPSPNANLAAVVMAGGLGTRMRSATPKHFHSVLGRRLVDWVLEAARPIVPGSSLTVVTGSDWVDLYDGLGVSVAVQERPLGTGDAVRSARAAVGAADEVLVLSGDTPLLTTELLTGLVETHREHRAVATVLSFEPDEMRSYGRVVRGAHGMVRAIVEAADASPEELALREANSSIYMFRAGELWPALERIEPVNAQGELYLTDAVRVLVDDGARVVAHLAVDPREAEGVNTRVELAAAGAVLRDRINEAHMLAGVTIDDPESTWIEPDVQLEPDAIVRAFTLLRGTTRVGAGAEVGPHAVAVDSVIGDHAIVGPFCYLRPGTVLRANSKAGTFVELKNTQLAEGAKVPHLSYMGDAEIGERTNVGAGAITVNLPHRKGSPKQRTTLGRDVRVGVDTVLVAPVTIGDDAWTAAGSVVTDDVPDNALVGFPPRQTIKEGRGGKRDD